MTTLTLTINLDDPRVAEKLSDDVYEALLKLQPKTNPNDNTAHLRVRARAQVDALRATGQLAGTADDALYVQAERISKGNLYRYHDEEFDNAEEVFKSALDGVKRNSSTWYDLTKYTEVVLPFLDKRGKSGLAKRIYVKGQNIGKSRAALSPFNDCLEKASRAKTDEERERWESTAEAILADVANSDVNIETFQTRYLRFTKSTISEFSVWDYTVGEGDVLVIVTTSGAQKEFVRRQLDVADEDWHAGTGDEPVLQVLVNRKKVTA